MGKAAEAGNCRSAVVCANMEHLTEAAIIKNKHRDMLMESLFKKNSILVSGMVIPPVAAFAYTFENAVTLSVTFTSITLFTLLFSSFVPKKIVYAIRIILYTIIGSLVYIVTAAMLDNVIPDKIAAMGIYFPLLITNSFILTRSEVIFSRERRTIMFVDIIFCILGYVAAVLIYGLIREILSTGGIGSNILAVSVIYPVFRTTFGGFLLLGIFAAVYRAALLFVKQLKG
jgi:electron transport complex protein RnfE